MTQGHGYGLGRTIWTTVCATALMVVSATSAFSQAADQFYQGKTIRVVIGLGAGGGYDSYARLATRWIGKYIPGSPALIAQNMPGAGGITAANHVYNVALKDGTVMGALHANVAFAQVTGTANVEYDARQLNWVGRTASGGLDIHHTWHTTGITSFDQLFTRTVIVAGGGPTSNAGILPNALNELMGTKLKILPGYKGTAETTLALERGEVEMALKNWEALRSANADWVRDKKINLLVQYNFQRHPELPNVPTIMELAKNEEQKQVWTLVLSTSAVGYALSMPPGVPADRVAQVRKAFDTMVKDPGLLADAEKAKLDLDPQSGEQLRQFIQSMFKVNPAAIERAKSLFPK